MPLDPTEPIEWPEDFDPLTIPAVMPATVRRTTNEGYPTQFMLDWEQGLKGWMQKNQVDLNNKLTKIYEETDFAYAAVTALSEAFVNSEEAFASYTVTVEARFQDNEASVVTESTARATADSALASQITTLTATVDSVSSSVTSEATARATADSALASQINTVSTNLGTTNAYAIGVNQARIDGDAALATSISTLSTTVAGNTATLTSQASSINGISLKYALTGTINGSTGGLIFTGVQQNGGGAVYNLEIFAGVTIHGDLTVNGTISTPKAAASAFTQGAGAGSGGTTAAVGIVTRDGAKVQVIGAFNGASGAYVPLGTNPGQLVIYRDGGVIAVLNSNFEASGTGTGAGLALQSTVALAIDAPSAGYHEYTVQTTNAFGVGGVTISVLELAR